MTPAKGPTTAGCWGSARSWAAGRLAEQEARELAELALRDAYFYHREIAADDPHAHPLLDLVQLDAQVDAPLRIANQQRLRDAATGGAGEERIRVLNAHDPWDYLNLTGA